ncbi:hypothetical protein QQM39_09935 [Streptomyces sp. DT2A-34]|uniref:hypothetical protein n=1 Tax=Streptomyces sp. DT2A-34 TaxID=3051182 RepID=UPI00265C71CC|nr:hypothetical protein [Streptomyces sp. DT2A-34]MDO0911161.1 hypothetical protein [Streptomyces sp. DT2A-34]
MGTILDIIKSLRRREAAVRALAGAHLPGGKPLVRVRCGKCGARVATVEENADGEIVTYWAARDRRFPGVVPRLLDCPEDGDLPLDEAAVRAKLRAARRTGRVQTLKLFRP